MLDVQSCRTLHDHERLTDLAVGEPSRDERHRLALTRRGFWLLVPDRAIEVRSPGDRHAAWRAKLAAYAGVAGGRLWAIDPRPRARSVEFWRDGQPLQTLTEPDHELELEDLVPGSRLPLRELWALSSDG